jgi:hypothetical protein
MGLYEPSSIIKKLEGTTTAGSNFIIFPISKKDQVLKLVNAVNAREFTKEFR